MSAQTLSTKKIIIVEDAPVVAMHLKFFLESLGYEVAGMFKSGEDLLRFLDEGITVDGILMDIMLEGKLDGIETVLQIRLKHDFPIIFLSALSDDETIKRIKSVKSNGHIIKPFSEEQLQVTLSKSLSS